MSWDPLDGDSTSAEVQLPFQAVDDRAVTKERMAKALAVRGNQGV